jgi:TonB family protein
MATRDSFSQKYPSIPGYIVLKEIGKGGIAIVYSAKETKLDREVALKVLHPSLAKEEHIVKRFIAEAKTAAKLNHSNIVSIYDVGQTGDICFFTMELLDQSLRDKIASSPPPPYSPMAALSIIKTLVEALIYAHGEQCIHRDIKPSNILFRGDGSPVLVDFGIPDSSDSKIQLSKTLMSKTSSYYSSPEKIKGLDLDERTDFYNLGIVLYEMLTGKVAFDGKNTVTISMKHLQEPTPRLPEHLSYFQPLINMMLAKDREERIQKARELSRLMAFYLDTEEPVKIKNIALSSPQTFKLDRTPGHKKAKKPASKKRPKKMFYLGILGIVILFVIVCILFYPKGGAIFKINETSPPAVTTTPEIPQAEPKKVTETKENIKPKYDTRKIARIQTPVCLKRVTPDYPQEALNARIQGKVVIEAVTDIEGTVVQATIKEGNALLRKAALDAVNQWKYKPYYINMKPQPVVFEVILEFKLEDVKPPPGDKNPQPFSKN